MKTGGSQNCVIRSCPVNGASGVHDLYFVFIRGEEPLFSFDYWSFE
jgi:arabinoxylan arabinofuranohydrolase